MGVFGGQFGRGSGSALIVPASVSLPAGTLNSGNVASLRTFNDGNYYNVQEVAAAPGFTIAVQFTGVSTFNAVLVNEDYLGNLQHIIELGIYNNVLGAWDVLAEISDQTAFNPRVWGIINPAPYILNGVVNVRINHVSTGNITHNILVDYVALRMDY